MKKSLTIMIVELEQIIDDFILKKQECILIFISNLSQKIRKELNNPLIFTRYIKNNLLSTVRLRLLKI